MKGRIIKVFGKFYTVEYNEIKINCVLRGKIKKDPNLKKFSEPVSVGDFVDFSAKDDNTGVIDEIFERRNVFSRKDKIKGKEDLIAANLDQVVVVQSFKNPKLNLRFVDRILVRCAKENIPCILCVNKQDISKDEDTIFIENYYKNSSIKFFYISALTGNGLEEFRNILKNKLSILVGYSGVGKSSILNRLFPGVDLRTTEVSESTGKGKHTTTNVELVSIDDDTEIIDTPGVREFGLMDIDPVDLSDYFDVFDQFVDKCNFKTCTHDHEPGCEIKMQVENGEISEERYISYLNILYSLIENQKNKYK